MGTTLYNGDCLIESDKIENGSVDLILTDLPYGTMKGIERTGLYGPSDKPKHDWDSVIDTDKIMQVAKRILRENGRMVLFCQEPFTSELMSKQIPGVPFNQRIIWEKDSSGNMLHAKKAYVNFYEDILVFTKKQGISNNDMDHTHPLRGYFLEEKESANLSSSDIKRILGNQMGHHYFGGGAQFLVPTLKNYEKLQTTGYFKRDWSELKSVDDTFNKSKADEWAQTLIKYNEQYPRTFNLWQGNKYKSNILKYKKDYNGYHPTQKPVLLLEDLIKTFSNENDLVVDLTMGSGSTGVACVNTNRNFIGIEMDDKYFKIAQNRINGENR